MDDNKDETPKTKEEKNKENKNEINEEVNNDNKINFPININDDNQPKEEISNFDIKDYILYSENNKENKYYLNLFHNNLYYYFKLSKDEPENVSFSFFFNKLDYPTLLNRLKANENLFPDFNSIEEILLKAIEKKEVYIKDESDITMNIVFKIMDKDLELKVYKEEMNENEKFEKISKEMKDLKYVNEDKIEELKKISKEVEDETNLKCSQNKELLDNLEMQVNQNKADIDSETNEIELLKEEIQKIKEEVKENEDKFNNKKDCVIF